MTAEPQPPGVKENGAKHNRRRNHKKKKSKSRDVRAVLVVDDVKPEPNLDEDDEEGDVEIQYVGAEIEAEQTTLSAFKDVFAHFATPEELTAPPKEKEVVPKKEKSKKEELKEILEKIDTVGELDEEEVKPAEKQDDQPKMSKKARKRSTRLSVAALKQLVERPDVVEVWDTTATDPRTLVFLKACRNTVPVPQHWCQKRKFLQGKRGIEKVPFQLPSYIAATGIQEMRDPTGEDDKSSKQKQRERLAPKMGRVDINYQVLHDAFFKYQTKPPMTKHGEMYYEGKEFEVSLRTKRPGQLSTDLREALDMSEKSPPPWIINMQRYGPPPSYPSLRIPGINAPLPANCDYGYNAGQWGKPPIDEEGNPLYGGNPFDPPGSEPSSYHYEQRDKRPRWGLLRADESSEEEYEAEQPSEPQQIEDHRGTFTPGGLDSVSAFGAQTPEAGSIDIRKAIPGGKDTPAELYQVLPEHQTSIGGSQFGSDKKYEVPVQSVNQLLRDKKKTDTTEKVQVFILRMFEQRGNLFFEFWLFSTKALKRLGK
eukprot:c19853_g1_i4.p1 GENE.c19853_g1_i4~~c19853_g1_i4.p1  ORF type:complete len:538 (+),score=126.69 c19853_g1_i4:41-1654(+)